jgi:hypothetical protein
VYHHAFGRSGGVLKDSRVCDVWYISTCYHQSSESQVPAITIGATSTISAINTISTIRVASFNNAGTLLHPTCLDGTVQRHHYIRAGQTTTAILTSHHTCTILYHYPHSQTLNMRSFCPSVWRHKRGTMSTQTRCVARLTRVWNIQSAYSHSRPDMPMKPRTEPRVTVGPARAIP